MEPQLVKDVRDRKLQKKEMQPHYYNRNAKELPSLTEGDIVIIKPQAGDAKQRWIEAQVEEQVDVRSYAVRTEDGRLFRQENRSCSRMFKLKFRVQSRTVHLLSSALNQPL